LLWRYGQQGGRYKLSAPGAYGRISLSSRGISDAQINLCMSRLASILDRAARKHGLTIRDPTVDLRLRVDAPERNWLWPDHLNLLTTVARGMDVTAGNYDHNGREAALWVLGLCGPRVHEFCGFDWRDLSDGGLRVRASKTPAGVRTIQVPDIARSALERHRQRLGDPAPETPIWPTATGARRNRASVRGRLLEPVLNQARTGRNRSELSGPLPDRVTPHTFRRSAATYWYWVGRGERDTMHEIGHRSSRLTLEVYAQARPRDPRQQKLLEGWMQGVDV
jgi:integrase